MVEELGRQMSSCMVACSKEVVWVKKHMGAVVLTQSVTRGYASWSFEEEAQWDDRATKPSKQTDINKALMDGSAAAVSAKDAAAGTAAGGGGGGGTLALVGTTYPSPTTPVPPKHPPPGKAPSGPRVDTPAAGPGSIGMPEAKTPGAKKPTVKLDLSSLRQVDPGDESGVIVKRPKGPPPLSALGHRPDLLPDGTMAEGGPYQQRRRRRVPYMAEIIQVRILCC